MTDIDFNQWDKELVLPPVENCLRLCDYLPEETQSFLTSSGLSAEVLTYTWQQEITYDKVARWGKAAMLAGQVKQPTGSESFFISAIKDAYDYDRALRAAKALGRQPIRRKDIKVRISGGAPSNHHIQYVLEEQPFAWTVDTPDWAVNATASVMETERPDRLWLVEYVQEKPANHQPVEPPTVQTQPENLSPVRQKRMRLERRKWDPIIYAEYGDWQVEVARWE